MNDFDTFWHEAKAALRVALQWFFLAVPMGLLCGFLGTLFHLAVEHATELRAAQPWLLFLLPVAGLLITALYKVTKCEGVGTNNVIRAVQSGEPVSILLVPAIFLGTVLTHLCGGSAGREGAALQMGGSIGWNLGTLLRLKDHDRRTATISGMAAFFSALFGTPLAAACFAMMVEDVGLTFTSAFVPAFTSALIAYGCSLVFGIAPTHFALTAPELNVRTALLVIVLMGVWQFGSCMLVFLSGLKQIPVSLYESASLDGASKFQQFWKITMPMLTPTIFFNLIQQIITGFRVFTESYVITNGGPMNSTLTYVLYLYRSAFANFHMGYSCALAWILVALIGIMTLILFKSQKAWVHYEG